MGTEEALTTLRKRLSEAAANSAANVGLVKGGSDPNETVAKALEGIDGLPQQGLWTEDELKGTVAAAAREAQKIAKLHGPASMEGVVDYDKLTEEERRAQAGSIVGSDEEDGRRMKEWDEAEAAGANN